MYKYFNKAVAIAVISLTVALTSISNVYADDIPYGPGYTANVITSEVESPNADGRGLLDDIESKKFRVTGYNQSDYKEITEILDYIYNTTPDSNGQITCWIDRDVCNIQEFSEFMTFEYSLSGSLPEWSFRTHSNRPNEYEILVNYNSCKDVIDKHNEAKRLITEKIAGKEATLETVQQLYADIVNNTTYDRSYETYTTAYDVLVNHQSTCHGIAVVMNKMLEQMGIESYYVLGDTEAGYHAWNTCVVDGNAYTFDATYALSRKGTDRMWNTFKADSSMTLGDGRIIRNIY